MKKKEFLDGLNKRFKYVREGTLDRYGFDGLKQYQVDIAMINCQEPFELVYRDIILFWVRNEDKPNEKILDVEWKGSYSGINKEIESLLVAHDIYTEYGIKEKKRNEDKY